MKEITVRDLSYWIIDANRFILTNPTKCNKQLRYMIYKMKFVVGKNCHRSFPDWSDNKYLNNQESMDSV